MIPKPLGLVAKTIGGELRAPDSDAAVERVSIDSRGASPGSLFFALPGLRTDGHDHLSDAFRNGAVAAVLSSEKVKQIKVRPDWNVIIVSSPMRALQELAKWYRRDAFVKVLAVTGSNGKTITKDALGALLAKRSAFVSPGSYNGQLGLPLSILSAERREELGILEIGISEPGEMLALRQMASPDYGVLTNIGVAHFSAFGSREAIAREKLRLFDEIGQDGWVLVPSNEPLIAAGTSRLGCPIFEVGVGAHDIVGLKTLSLTDKGVLIELSDNLGGCARTQLLTNSAHIIADLHLAATAAYKLGVPIDQIAATFENYVPPSTRMETWLSPGGTRIINDAYSSDPISVGAALKNAAALANRSGRKIFAFGGMRELGPIAAQEHRQVGILAAECGFDPIFLVGNGHLASTADGYKSVRPTGTIVDVVTPEKLGAALVPSLLAGDTVLLKGPRNTGMAQAAREISGSIAQRCLWVDIPAIKENLNLFQRHCGGRTKIMVMLKALSYGTDLVTLASSMKDLPIHSVGVSSTAEGVAVRNIGGERNILVFLSEAEDIDELVRYRLTPVIYSSEMAEAFVRTTAERSCSLDVHLKIDTGMHRLGVNPDQAVDVARMIRDCSQMNLAGVCTHFACAEDPDADSFTRKQISVFDKILSDLRDDGFHELQIHASNTAAAARFPEARYDLVRIGLGLYGIYPSEAVRHALPNLELAVGVTSHLARIQTYVPGDSIGYGRTHLVKQIQKIGVIPFGYDDGLPWNLSGVGSVLVGGGPAPIVGRVSMDQLQVDVTEIKGARVGTEVLIWGSHGGHCLRPEKVAHDAGTIAHELLVRLGRRVHRVYIEER